MARERDFSEEIAAAIDQEERKTINECYDRAKGILAENKDSLILVAETLLEKETLKAEEFENLLSGKSLDEKEKPAKEVSDESPEGVESVSRKGFAREIKTPGGRVTPVPEVH